MKATVPRKPASKPRKPPHPPTPQPPPPPPAGARVFWSGRSQAVRLPKELRLSTKVVLVHREGDRLILVPLPTAVDDLGWPKGFWSSLGTVDDDFDLGDRSGPHERPDPLGEG
jgi:antitoxin VapB